MYELQSELYSTIIGWIVGFYLIASFLMYIIMAFSGMMFSDRRTDIDDDEDMHPVTGGILRSLALGVYGLVFALIHVVMYGLLASVFTLQYLNNAAGNMLTANGTEFHVHSMIYAWLIAGAFGVATAVAWRTADASYALVMNVARTIADLFGLAAAKLVKRRGWLVDEKALASILFVGFFGIVWTIAMLVIWSDRFIGNQPWLWFVPIASILFVAGYGGWLWRQHRDTATLMAVNVEAE